MDQTVLREVALAPHHRATGKTRHFAGGALLPPPRALRIARYVGDTGYYLIYLNAASEEQTDTWHETLDAAQRQAELEFGVRPSDWRVIQADV